ncbi:MAG: NAD-dependent epimerase/dehydratase family protein [Planctomycetota bacterium]|jgi:nucleoside-diphosphate-sugar epimerase
MAKYLVTGGAGFIGSNLVEALVSSGDKVVVYDDFRRGRKRNVQDYKQTEVRVVEGDVRDLKTLKRAAKGCDFLLHLASIPGVARSVKAPEETVEVSVMGTLNALVAARDAKIKRFIYASSCAVYGESPVLPKEETMLPSPYSPYGGAALAAEELARVFYNTYRIETVCLRLFNIYGPRELPDDADSGVVAQFIGTLLRGKTPVIYGDGKQSRDFIHVSDVVEAFRLACTAPKAEGEVFNIASGSRLSITGLLAVFNQLLDLEITPEMKDGRPADVRHSLAETIKAQEILGFRPRMGLHEGLVKTMIWFRRSMGKAVKLPRSSTS